VRGVGERGPTHRGCRREGGRVWVWEREVKGVFGLSMQFGEGPPATVCGGESHIGRPQLHLYFLL
jgi:hypothetical protein